MIQTVNINVAALPALRGPGSFMVLSQNENGRQLRFRILGSDLPTGCTATFSGTKPDGNVYSTTGTVSGNFVIVQEDIQMTAVAGVWDAKLDIINGTHNIMTALIRVVVDADVVDPDAIASDSQLQGLVAEAKYYAEHARTDAYGSPLTAPTKAQMTDHTRVYVYTGSEPNMVAGNWYLWNGSAWTSGGVYNAVAVQTDTTLSVAGKAADAKKTGDEISSLKEDLNNTIERLDQLDGGGMTEEAKQALLTLVSHIGLWDDDHGQDYIDALEAALYPPASLTHITAVYTQTGDVYTDTSLDSLRSDLVVTAHYSDSTSETISAYTLSGTLTEGTSTVTVSYGGKTATFSVTVTGRLLPSSYQQLEYIYSENGAYFESAVSPRTYPIRIETGIYKESQASAEQAIICKKIGTSSALEVGYNATSNTLFAYSGASAKVTDPVVYGNVIDVVAEFNSASPYKTLNVTANGESVSAQNTDANNTNILNTNNLLFFGSGPSSMHFIGRMYYCRVYSDGELIGNFIPCYDKETGYAGMYETVGGTFHYSQGSRGFKRGGEV